MFCANCGAKLQDGSVFCASCGSKVGAVPVVQAAPQEVKVMLDPAEVVPEKETADSSKSFSGQGKTFGLILMIISIIGDLLAMVLVGFDAFIPVTIGATVLFVIGFLLRMFCP
jgi:hypothetical protein